MENAIIGSGASALASFLRLRFKNENRKCVMQHDYKANGSYGYASH